MLHEYNSIIKENDDIYRALSKSFGLPDCTFWILYSLRESGQEMTQSDLCSILYMPKQTIHSSLKKLEQDGCVLFLAGNNKKTRYIRLTPKGLDLCARTVDKVLLAEESAFSSMSDEEQQLFLSLFQKSTGLLKNQMEELMKTISDELSSQTAVTNAANTVRKENK